MNNNRKRKPVIQNEDPRGAPGRGGPPVNQVVPQSRFDLASRPIDIDFTTATYTVFAYREPVPQLGGSPNVGLPAQNQPNINVQQPFSTFFSSLGGPNLIQYPYPDNTNNTLGNISLRSILPQIRDTSAEQRGVLNAIVGPVSIAQVRKQTLITLFKGLNYLSTQNGLFPWITRARDIFYINTADQNFLTLNQVQINNPILISLRLPIGASLILFNFINFLAVLDTDSLSGDKVTRGDLLEKHTFIADSAMIQILSILNFVKYNIRTQAADDNHSQLYHINLVLEAFFMCSSLKQYLDVGQFIPIANRVIFDNQQGWSNVDITGRMLDQQGYVLPIHINADNAQIIDRYNIIDSLSKKPILESHDNAAIKIAANSGAVSYSSSTMKGGVKSSGSIPFVIDQKQVFWYCFLYDFVIENRPPLDQNNSFISSNNQAHPFYNQIWYPVNQNQQTIQPPSPNDYALLDIFWNLVYDRIQGFQSNYVTRYPKLFTDIIYMFLSTLNLSSILQQYVYIRSVTVLQIKPSIYYLISTACFLYESNNLINGRQSDISWPLRTIKNNYDFKCHDNQFCETYTLALTYNFIYSFVGNNGNLLDEMLEMFGNAENISNLLNPLDRQILPQQTYIPQAGTPIIYPFTLLPLPIQQRVTALYEPQILGYCQTLIKNFSLFGQQMFYYIASKTWKDFEAKGLFSRLSDKSCYVFQKRVNLLNPFDLTNIETTPPTYLVVDANQSVYSAYTNIARRNFHIQQGQNGQIPYQPPENADVFVPPAFTGNPPPPQAPPLNQLQIIGKDSISTDIIIPQQAIIAIDLVLPDGQSTSSIVDLPKYTSMINQLFNAQVGDSPIGINDAASRIKHASEILIQFPATPLPLPLGPTPSPNAAPQNAAPPNAAIVPARYNSIYYMIAQQPAIDQPDYFANQVLTNPHILPSLGEEIVNYLSRIRSTNLKNKLDAVDWGSAVYFAYLSLFHKFSLQDIQITLTRNIYLIVAELNTFNPNFYGNFVGLFRNLSIHLFTFVENYRNNTNDTLPRQQYKTDIENLTNNLILFFNDQNYIINDKYANYYYILTRYILCPLDPEADDDRIHCEVEKHNVANSERDSAIRPTLFQANRMGYRSVDDMLNAAMTVRSSNRRKGGGSSDILNSESINSISSFSKSASKSDDFNLQSVPNKSAKLQVVSNTENSVQKNYKPKETNISSNTYLFGKYGFYFGVNSSYGFEIVPINTEEELKMYEKNYLNISDSNELGSNESDSNESKRVGGKYRKNYTLKRTNKKLSKKIKHNKIKYNKSMNLRKQKKSRRKN
jgi:hypothetical protein